MQPRRLPPTLTLAASTVLSLTARGLEGTAAYTPAESNIAGNYWVKGAAKSGTAGAALDGDPATNWTPNPGEAALTVDLGGSCDSVHKIRLRFADDNAVHR